MKNFILGITSFIMAVIFLSQVALAADTDDGDPNHKNAATSIDPNLKIRNRDPDLGAKGGPSDPTTEAGVANAGQNCPDGTCNEKTVAPRMQDYTSSDRGAKGGPSDPTNGAKSDAK